MKCSKCGKEIADGSKFCEYCGADLTTTEQPAEAKTEAAPAPEAAAPVPAAETAPVAQAVSAAQAAEAGEDAPKKDKPKTNLKKILIPVVAVVAIIVLIALVGSLASSSGSGNYKVMSKKTIVELMSEDDTVYALLVDGTMKDLKVEKKSGTNYSQDRTTAVFLDDEDELMIYKNEKLIATGIDDVKSIVVSACGDTVAYLTEVKNGCGTLFLYDVKSKKEKEIDEDVAVGTIVLSPDGKTVAYVGDYEDDEDFKGYYSVNGKKPVEVGKEKRVFAISNGGSYVYYQDGDRLYVKKGKKDAEKLATDTYSFRAIFNADMSQIIYTSDDKTYISDKGKEKKKISSDSVSSVVLPQDAIYGSYSSGRGSIRLSFVKDFAKQLLYINGDIYYLKPDFETVKVASNVYSYALAKNGKKMYVLGSKQDIIEVTDFAKGGKKKDMTKDGDAEGFITDLNLKKLYVQNEDDELLIVKKPGKTAKISDDVTSVTISKDGTECYFVVEGETLYYSKNGGKRSKIKEADSIECNGQIGYTFVSIDDDDEELICTISGKKLKEIYKEEK